MDQRQLLRRLPALHASQHVLHDVLRVGAQLEKLRWLHAEDLQEEPHRDGSARPAAGHTNDRAKTTRAVSLRDDAADISAESLELVPPMYLQHPKHDDAKRLSHMTARHTS